MSWAQDGVRHAAELPNKVSEEPVSYFWLMEKRR
jgi:hypothetical protein